MLREIEYKSAIFYLFKNLMFIVFSLVYVLNVNTSSTTEILAKFQEFSSKFEKINDPEASLVVLSSK